MAKAPSQEEVRAWVMQNVDRALASGEMQARVRAGTRILPPQPGDTWVRREFTGKRALLVTWEEKPNG